MPLPEPLHSDSVYEFRVRGAHEGMNQEFSMVTDWKVEGIPVGGSPLTTADLATDLRIQWRNGIRPRLSTLFVTQRYELREIIGRVSAAPRRPGQFKLSYRDLIVLPGGGITDRGGDLGDTMPPAVSIAVLRRANLVGRANFGNLRIGPAQESDFDADLMPAIRKTAWENALAWLRDGTTLTGATTEIARPVLLHRKKLLDPAAPAAPPATATVTIDRLVVGVHAGTQRSRKQPNARPGF